MDGNGSLFGTLSGNTREILHKFSVDLPKKHGRGGQSALRFARLRMEKRHNYVRKVAELATQIFITNDKPNVAGLVLSGSADFKTELSQSDLFDPRLQAVVIGVVDVSYGKCVVVLCFLCCVGVCLGGRAARTARYIAQQNQNKKGAEYQYLGTKNQPIGRRLNGSCPRAALGAPPHRAPPLQRAAPSFQKWRPQSLSLSLSLSFTQRAQIHTQPNTTNSHTLTHTQLNYNKH